MTEQNERVRAAEYAVRRAEQSAEGALAALERAHQRLEQAMHEPTEPPKGSTVKFWVRFPGGGARYTYVATRTETGQWYVTNKEGVYTWSDVLSFASRDVDVKAGKPLRIRLLGKGRWISE